MSVSGILNMHNAYDGSFLTLMIVANFVQGFRQLLDLSLLVLFKDVMDIQPGEV
jgi:hypothetical protein